MAGMIKDLRKFNRLARIANSSMGTSGPGEYRTSTQHVRFELINEKTMKVHYQGAIAVPSKSMLGTIMSKLVNDALKFVGSTMEKFSENYKKEFGKDVTLEINEATIMDNVEFTSYSVFKPTQSAMLRVSALINVSGGDNVEEYDFDKDNDAPMKKSKKEREDFMKSNKEVTPSNKKKKD